MKEESQALPKLLALTVLICSCVFAWGAITGPVDVAQNGASTSVFTLPITNNAATDSIGIVNFGVHDSTDADRVVVTVTWGLSAMTAAGYLDNLGDNKSGGQYYLVNPPTGSNDVVITFAGTVSGVAASATTWEGVDQASPLNAVSFKTNSTATVVSISATSSVDSVLFIDQYTKYLVTGTVTPAGDQTVLGNAAVGAAYWQATTYNNAGLAAGAKTFTYTNSLTSGTITIMGAYAPTVAAAGSTNYGYPFTDLRLMGVGQ